MSSCVVISNGEITVMAADTALSSFHDGIPIRVGNNTQKIFNFHNSLVFCSGEEELVKKVVLYIEKSSFLNVDNISAYLKSMSLPKRENIFNIELLIISSEHSEHILYQISEYEDFSVIKRTLSNGSDLQIYTAGIKSHDIMDAVCHELSETRDVHSVLSNVYKKFSCPQIGGTLQIWGILDAPFKIREFPIDFETQSLFKSDSFLLIADVIVGRLLAGNSLTISNENNNFILDASGAYLNNARFSIQTTNTKVVIDPTSTTPFRIQKNTGGTFSDKFWVDNTGNVNFSGNLSGASGTFSGSLSGATGTFAGSLSAATGTFAGTLSAASGTFRGQLLAATGSFSGDISAASGTFSGNIYADKIYGQVVDTQIASGLDAGKITVGTMSADRIYGGTISWPGASMGDAGYGYAYITADINLSISSPGNVIVEAAHSTIRGYTDVLVTSDGAVYIDSGSGIRIYGDILSTNGGDSGWGITGTINPNAYNNFYFVNGILVDYY